LVSENACHKWQNKGVFISKQFSEQTGFSRPTRLKAETRCARIVKKDELEIL
jgi:hypothetical protein